ncbi:MAG: hypothetical protein CSA07_03010 [Bacteroidia bacterium]|nr:MAG: hypothetical protein CSA07_03010 [Bacteroidia bacterium]
MARKENRPLLLYKASAGTGKTYTLARRFVELSIVRGEPYAFARILAVTFTRKATAEMKARIVRFLSSLRDDDDPQLMEGIMGGLRSRGLEISKRGVQARAGDTLHAILHEYSRFTVSTIDSFLKDMATSLFWELGISPEVTVRLDEEQMVEEATVSLLQHLAGGEGDEGSQHEELYAHLRDILHEQMAERGKRTLLEELGPVGREIFREPFVRKSRAEQQEMLRMEARRTLRELLRAEREEARHAVVRAFGGFMAYVRERGYEGALTGRRKGQYSKLGSHDEVDMMTEVPKALKDVEGNFTRSLPLAGEARAEFLATVGAMLGEAQSALMSKWTYDAALQSFDRFATLAHIREELLRLEREGGQLPLKEFSVMLNQLREGDDLSFIFERMGVRYDSLFIDEFQDTSRLQWDLLRPLVANSVGSGHQSLIVGDVKQSIYRWNGGDWKMLGEEVARDPELGRAVEEIHLEENFRSAPEIVEFNNRLFGQLGGQFEGYVSSLLKKTAGIGELDHLREELIAGADRLATTAYALRDRAQRQGEKGYVELTFRPMPPGQSTPDEEGETEGGAVEWATAKVRELIQREGVRPMDIAVIVRTRDMARQVVAQLLAMHRAEPIVAGFSVVSQDGLQLASSYSVGLALAGLRIVAGLGTDIDRGLIASFERLSPHWAWYLKRGREDERGAASRAIFGRLLELKGYPLLDAFDRVCRLLGLPESAAEKPYLDKLRDMLYTYMKGESTSIAAFVQWYDTCKGGEQTIDLVQSEMSVNVLTVHKAKGLEFEVVLCPDANLPLRNPSTMAPTIWAESTSIAESPALDGRLFPVSVSTKHLLTGFGEAVKEDFFLQMVDALNVLYVAFTRPRAALYIYYEMRLNGKEGEYTVRSVPRIFNQLLHDTLSGLFGGGLGPNDPAKTCRFPEGGGATPGRRAAGETGERRTLERIADRQGAARRVDLALSIGRNEDLQSAINRRRAAKRGERLHAIMAGCPTGELDGIGGYLARELGRLRDIGLLDDGEAGDIGREITQTIGREEALRASFISPPRSLAERDILLEDGSTCRPDRVTVHEGRTIILDYKFGQPQAQHQRQLRDYGRVMAQLGYPGPEAYLWYVQGKGLERVALD